jgi:hypothetical protein
MTSSFISLFSLVMRETEGCQEKTTGTGEKEKRVSEKEK